MFDSGDIRSLKACFNRLKVSCFVILGAFNNWWKGEENKNRISQMAFASCPEMVKHCSAAESEYSRKIFKQRKFEWMERATASSISEWREINHRRYELMTAYYDVATWHRPHNKLWLWVRRYRSLPATTRQLTIQFREAPKVIQQPRQAQHAFHPRHSSKFYWVLLFLVFN